VRRTPENRRIAYASFYLIDNTQLCYHRLGLNTEPPLTDSPIGKIALLRRDDSVDDFAKRFMALSCRDTAIIEAHQV
jgi:hypothetical protein